MKRYKDIGQVVIFVLIFTLFFAVTHRFIIPVILGLLVSLVFRPVYVFIHRSRKRSHLTAILCTVVLICCVLLPLFLIGSLVVKDFTQTLNQILPMNPMNKDHPQPVLESPLFAGIYQGINRLHPVSQEKFQESVKSILANLAVTGKDFVRAVLSSVPRVLTSMIFFLISFYFGLVDGPQLVKFLRENSPFSERDTDQLLRISHRICHAVVLGAFLAGIVQGIIIGLAYWILGIPKPLLFGVLTAIFGLIPLVGSAPAGIGGTIYLLTRGELLKALIMLGAFVLAGVSDNVVKPLVLKGKTAIHPLLGLMSVLGGMKAFGVSGIFLGPLITALTIVLLEFLHHRVRTMRSLRAETEAGAGQPR